MITKLIPRTQAEKLTGLTRADMYDLAHKGIIKIVKINARNFKVPESDLEDIPAKILAYERQQALAELDNKSGLSRETEEGLRKFFGAKYDRLQ